MPDESQNRETPEASGEDELGESQGFLPGDVSRRVFGSNPQGIACCQGSRPETAKAQRRAISSVGLLPALAYPNKIDAKGTEQSHYRGPHSGNAQLVSCVQIDSWAMPAPYASRAMTQP